MPRMKFSQRKSLLNNLNLLGSTPNEAKENPDISIRIFCFYTLR